VRLEVRGEGADLSDLQVWRDVYYEPGRFGGPWTIPADSYFMLGDNTQDSSDSRDWELGTIVWGPQGAEAEVGTYLVRLTMGEVSVEGTLTLREDPGLEGVLPSVR